MTQTLRVRGPADFLALIPALIGGAPDESVVFLLLRRDGNNGVMRVDIPEATSTAELKRFATQVMGMLCKVPDVERVVIAVFTGETLATGLPHAEWADILIRRTTQMGFRLHDALCHASDGWGSYLETDPPAGRYPQTELAEAIARIAPTIDSETREWQIPTATKAETGRMRDELAHYRDLLADMFDAALNDADPDAVDPLDIAQCPPELDPLVDIHLFVDEALDWGSTDIDTKGALLLLALQGPSVRDATMLQWAFGSDVGHPMYDATDFVSTGPPFKSSRAAAKTHLIAGVGPRPDQKRIEQGIDLLLTLVARAEPTERRAPLCMLAWLTWALGSGSRAGKFIDLALEIDPSYNMARLLDALFNTMQLPEWTFTPPAREHEAI